MSEKSMPKGLIYGIAAVFMFSLLSALVISAAKKSVADLPIYGTNPQFELTERSGEPFHSKEMQGRLWLVDFIFTNCQGACPTMSGHMSDFYKLYAHSDKINFLSISVDPQRDTLDVLREYAASQGVTDNRWLFTRGDIDDVIDISENGYMLAAENLPMGHSTKFVLIDHNGQIRGYYDALYDPDVEQLKTHIRELARAM
jgi:protein SCO1/2